MQVERDGQPVNITIPEDFASKLINTRLSISDMRVPFVQVDSVVIPALQRVRAYAREIRLWQ
jgi:hypothetical protein